MRLDDLIDLLQSAKSELPEGANPKIRIRVYHDAYTRGGIQEVRTDVEALAESKGMNDRQLYDDLKQKEMHDDAIVIQTW